MNHTDYVKDKLKLYSAEDIIFTDHTIIRLAQRELDLEEIRENIINPVRLQYAVREEAEKPEEEKFDCYFGYGKYECHRYVLVLSQKVMVVTAVKINRQWQRIAEAKLRKA